MRDLLTPGSAEEIDERCEKHARVKVAVPVVSISELGVDGDVGRVTFCVDCAQEGD